MDINNQYPHFALMPLSENQIVFTSYRLKKNGKVKSTDSKDLSTKLEPKTIVKAAGAAGAAGKIQRHRQRHEHPAK